MKRPVFVGIDTSNYTTSVAVSTIGGEVLANLKQLLPVEGGACGLRQSDAVFAHVKNLPILMDSLKEVLTDCEVRAVGVSSAPRSQEGSYMPCFLSGVAAASTMAAGLGVPLYSFSHQEGHVMAALYSARAAQRLMEAPFAAFHVSGGTTDVLLVTPHAVGFSISQVGGTKDINAGQAIDRAGVMMGLQFPCGKELEALATSYQGTLPTPRICVKDGFCNLSGLQNLSEKLWEQTGDRCAVSAFVLSFVGKTLEAMTRDLDRAHPGLPIVYAGGVMGNALLQALLGKRPDTYFADPAFSSDNAAGIALLCRRQYLHSEK
ncbi:MAG: peptidase M22 [Clostridia bacterium]|nr:peptidase M22 [Clostridia bacterium]